MIVKSEKISPVVLERRVPVQDGRSRTFSKEAEGQPLWRRTWQRWKRIAKTIGDFQARLLLGSFYFLVLSPFALFLRSTGDPLAIKRGTTRGWHLRSPETGTRLERARDQF